VAADQISRCEIGGFPFWGLRFPRGGGRARTIRVRHRAAAGDLPKGKQFSTATENCLPLPFSEKKLAMPASAILKPLAKAGLKAGIVKKRSTI
jgi:hypothetical protein